LKITSKGQVTIPQEIREALGFLPNSEVEFKIVGKNLQITKSTKINSRGKILINRMKGKSNVKMTTDEILKLTRS
jgi:AbrB family looped-hinge helix DNA binding protein